jgi:hypothetical protein
MSLIGKLHPHFPIALVLAAAGAEIVAIRTGRASSRAIDILRAGAAMSALTLIAGWALATAPFVEATPSLALRRWTGVTAVAATIGAALAA